jgi:hypothetical protein
MNTGFLLMRIAQQLGITPAIKQVIGAETIVQNKIVNRKTKARKMLENFYLDANPKLADRQMRNIMTAIEIDYVGHRGSSRAMQASQYFLDDIQELRSWIRIIGNNPDYDEIYPGLRDRYNLLMASLEENEELEKYLEQLNDSI